MDSQGESRRSGRSRWPAGLLGLAVTWGGLVGCSSGDGGLPGALGETDGVVSVDAGIASFTVSSTGEVTAGVSRILPTKIGPVRIGFEVSHDFTPEESVWEIRFRDFRSGEDIVRHVEADEELVAIVDGRTVLAISHRSIVVNITGGDVRSVKIMNADEHEEYDPRGVVERAGARWHGSPMTPTQRREWIERVYREGPVVLIGMLEMGGVAPEPVGPAGREALVRDLYAVFAGPEHPIDAEGLEYWTGRLARGATRVQVARAFVNAGGA